MHSVHHLHPSSLAMMKSPIVTGEQGTLGDTWHHCCLCLSHDKHPSWGFQYRTVWVSRVNTHTHSLHWGIWRQQPTTQTLRFVVVQPPHLNRGVSKTPPAPNQSHRHILNIRRLKSPNKSLLTPLLPLLIDPRGELSERGSGHVACVEAWRETHTGKSKGGKRRAG